VHDISVLNYIGLPLFLAVFRQLVLVGWIRNQSVAMDHLSIDEATGKVRMNLPSSLYCSFPSTNGPSPNLIRADSVEMSYFQLFVAGFDDAVDLGLSSHASHCLFMLN
jgi:hypothetical protein